jgi:hypothetical protein
MVCVLRRDVSSRVGRCECTPKCGGGSPAHGCASRMRAWAAGARQFPGHQRVQVYECNIGVVLNCYLPTPSYGRGPWRQELDWRVTQLINDLPPGRLICMMGDLNVTREYDDSQVGATRPPSKAAARCAPVVFHPHTATEQCDRRLSGLMTSPGVCHSSDNTLSEIQMMMMLMMLMMMMMMMVWCVCMDRSRSAEHLTMTAGDHLVRPTPPFPPLRCRQLLVVCSTCVCLWTSVALIELVLPHYESISLSRIGGWLRLGRDAPAWC